MDYAPAIVLSLIAAQLAPAADASWLHQYYEPIEKAECVREAEEAFGEAAALYGEPVAPVKEIHLRLSLRKAKPNRISRADILNWQALTERLTDEPRTDVYERIWGNIGPAAQQALVRGKAEALSLPEQIAIVEAFNRLIASPALPDLLGAVHQQRCNGFRSLWRRSDQEDENRRRLCTLFPGIIAPLSAKPGRLAEKFQLCECADAERGVYLIYVSVPPEEDEFHLQLAHEAHHLRDTSLYDWYAEGLGNVFAEHWAKRRSLSWEPWRALFARGAERDPYAIAYFMMREVAAAAGPETMRRFYASAVPWKKDGGKRCLDIDRWLAGIDAPAADRLRDIIRRYAPSLRQHHGRPNAFMPPRGE